MEALHADANVAFQDPKLLYIRCDVTARESIEAAASKIRQEFGSPSVLINCAGISLSAEALHNPPSDLERVIDINLKGPIYTCSIFGPDMAKKNKGHLVNIASMASFISIAKTADYAATKAGLLAYHEGMSKLLAALLRSI